MPRTRSALLATVATLAGFLFTLVLFCAAEFSYRKLSGRQPRGGGTRYQSPGLHVIQSVYDLSYSEPDSEVGSLPRPDNRTRVVKTRPDGSTGVDVLYSIDSERRRITPHPPGGRRNTPLFFLGCSYTYGDDLQDDETLPAAAARFQDQYRVYNYSFHAWGPNNLLRLVHQNSFARDVPPSHGGKAVYVYMNDHPNRVLGTLGIYRIGTGWESRLPYYYLNGNGGLETRGMISDRPFRNPLFRLLSQSTLLEALGIDLPLRSQEAGLELVSAILQDLELTLKQKFDGMELTTVIFPGHNGKALLPFLKERKLAYLDYSDLDARSLVSGPLTVADGVHPSAAMNRFLAKRILGDLNIRLRPTREVTTSLEKERRRLSSVSSRPTP